LEIFRSYVKHGRDAEEFVFAELAPVLGVVQAGEMNFGFIREAPETQTGRGASAVGRIGAHRAASGAQPKKRKRLRHLENGRSLTMNNRRSFPIPQPRTRSLHPVCTRGSPRSVIKGSTQRAGS
jgi:hypothetical protein